MTWLPSSSLKVVATPGWPFGLLVGGVAVKGTGAWMSPAGINNLPESPAGPVAAAGEVDVEPVLLVAVVGDPDFDVDGVELLQPATATASTVVAALATAI